VPYLVWLALTLIRNIVFSLLAFIVTLNLSPKQIYLLKRLCQNLNNKRKLHDRLQNGATYGDEIIHADPGRACEGHRLGLFDSASA